MRRPFLEVEGQPCFVKFRNYGFKVVPAMLCERVIWRDEQFSGGQRRYFWLLDYGVQLIYDSPAWPGEWRCDLVTIEAIPGHWRPTFKIVDMTVDIVVEGMGPTYRILDLDQSGQRLIENFYNPGQLADILCHTQRFIKAFLDSGQWPPNPIRPFFAANHNYPRLPSRRHKYRFGENDKR